MVPDYSRGAEWRMWDLHVHTPESVEHDYKPGSAGDAWDQFLSDLASLPADIQVLGINDYWHFDGYRRVRDEFEGGNLPNLSAIFPVLEMRCDSFGGTAGALSRLNLHLILDPELDIDRAESQLRPYLQATYRLTPGGKPETWSEIPTKESIIALGEKIFDATPKGKQGTLPGPFRTGFNNLCVSFDRVVDGIRDNSFLAGRVLSAIGKVEWADIKWTEGSIANKKHLINSVDAVFTAAPSRESFKKSLESLVASEVNANLLDCSDSHANLDSSNPNRLGQSFTWINSDPTFRGLRLAIQEYESRVSVEIRPRSLERVAVSPHTVINEFGLRRSGASSGSTDQFDVQIPVNHGFAVVIGNKGQGKSALLDSIALAGNSDRGADFSFLSPGRFLAPDNGEAGEYEAAINWADGSVSAASLRDTHDSARPVRVDYLPQSLIEKVCAADPASLHRREFEAEIEKVVFSHIPRELRGDARPLADLLASQAAEPQVVIETSRDEVARWCHEIDLIRERTIELNELGLDERRQVIADKLDEIETQILEIDGSLGSDASSGGGGTGASPTLNALRAAVETSSDKDAATHAALVKFDELTEAVQVATSALLERASKLRGEAADVAKLMGLKIDLVDVVVGEDQISGWLAARPAERSILEAAKAESTAELLTARTAVEDAELVLQEAGAESELLVQRRSDLARRRVALIGSATDDDSLEWVDALLLEREQLPVRLANALAERKTAFLAIHQGICAVAEAQTAAYAPAKNYVDESALASAVSLEFAVRLNIDSFFGTWIPKVNRQKLGDFFDLDGPDRDQAALSPDDLDDAEQLYEKLLKVEDRLMTERGSTSGQSRPLSSIVRSGFSAGQLLNEIFGLEWLSSQYSIRSEGAELSALSPGQRGLVLLLFYLVVDLSERPLLLDQPEENLDNQTVRNALVPALKFAAARRQVIAVTHNPNFAVVGDADQIIVASRTDGQFEYASGSLAAHAIGPLTVDVLEGTRAAFDARELKYLHVVG